MARQIRDAKKSGWWFTPRGAFVTPFGHTRMPVWLHRLFLVICAVAAAGVIAALAVVLSQTRAEYARLRELEAQTRHRLAEVETRLAEQEIVLDRLRGDPAYVEMVIRRRLGYAKPEEFVFRFEE